MRPDLPSVSVPGEEDERASERASEHHAALLHAREMPGGHV